MGENRVALRDEGFGEELTVVAKADYGDFEVVRGKQMGCVNGF